MSGSEVWTWRPTGLQDPDGVEIATVRSGIISVGAHQILTEISRDGMRLSINASTSQGEVFTLHQDGFSINRLVANCAGRIYFLDRTRRFRRERALSDAAGNVVARTRPQQERLAVFDHPGDAAVPDLDFVFITWACMEADNSGRVHI